MFIILDHNNNKRTNGITLYKDACLTAKQLAMENRGQVFFVAEFISSYISSTPIIEERIISERHHQFGSTV